MSLVTSGIQPTIYQMKNSRSETCGYLLGTIHYGDAEVANLSKSINKRIEKSATIAFERSFYSQLDVEELLIARVAQIEEELTTEQMDEILESYKACFTGIPEVDDKLKKIKTNKRNVSKLFALAILSSKLIDLCLQSVPGHGISQDQGVERAILQRFGKTKQNQNIVDLETIDAHKSFESVHLRPTKLDKDTPVEMVQGLQNLIKFWKAGDEEKLVKLLCIDSEDEKRVNNCRNEQMTNQIDAYLQKAEGGKKRVFVAVGFGHLPGDQGIVQLLRKKGWTLTKVASQNTT